MAQLSFLNYLRGIYRLDLSASSKVHYAVIQSIYDLFIMSKNDIDYMKLELCLMTATGKWLDYWGEYFSVRRKTNEEDNSYAKRIIDTVIRPKNTIPSLKQYIVDYINENNHTNYTTEDVSITEPWKYVAKYSHKGALSHDARFCSRDYYSHAVLDVSVPEDVTEGLMELVKAVKAAGVKVIWSIINSYDVISGFNTADDAWAFYHRWTQTKTQRNQDTGFVLSSSGGMLSGTQISDRKYTSHCLSGGRNTWAYLNTQYYWYVKVNNKNTDKSILITTKDLLNVVDFYDTPDGTSHEVTDKLLDSLSALDEFLTLSYHGRISTSTGTIFEYTSLNDTWYYLLEALNTWKDANREYYNQLQPPILNGERAMYYLQRNENWLWNTPTMTHQDFFDLWEPFGDYEEHTINSIVEFEDAYYKNYITFGDKYQPPIVSTKKHLWTTRNIKDWLFNSPVFANEDLEQVYADHYANDYVSMKTYDLQRWIESEGNKIYIVDGKIETNTEGYTYKDGNVYDKTGNIVKTYKCKVLLSEYEDPTLEMLQSLEDYFYEKYSIVGEVQPEIEIKSVKTT